jgi:hypothetical protein
VRCWDGCETWFCLVCLKIGFGNCGDAYLNHCKEVPIQYLNKNKKIIIKKKF